MRRPVAVAALLAGVVGAQDDALATRSGTCFEVVCHGGDDDLAALALAVVEPVWPLVCAAFGVAAEKPRSPLRVHLYRTPDGYREADQRLTGGRFQPNLAMSHWDSESAHVALQPPCSDAVLRESGLPLQTQAMLAWEACHVARFALCPNFRQHPGWFVDGLAATTAQRVLEQLHPGLGEQPFFTQRWLRARQMLDEGALPSVRELLSDAAELEMRDRYALRIAFYEFVAGGDRRRELVDLASTIRSLGGGTRYGARVRDAALEALGDLHAPFAASVRAREPEWDEAIRSLWCLGDDWHQHAFPDSNAVAWRQRPVAGGAFLARGELCIQPGRAQQLNFLFGRTAEGFYSLALTAGVGFTLFDHRYDGNEWRRVGNGHEPGLVGGEFVPFGVRGDGTRLDVELAGRSWSLQLPRPLPDQITWGIGAQAAQRGGEFGTVGRWRSVRVTAK